MLDRWLDFSPVRGILIAAIAGAAAFFFLEYVLGRFDGPFYYPFMPVGLGRELDEGLLTRVLTLVGFEGALVSSAAYGGATLVARSSRNRSLERLLSAGERDSPSVEET